jgi:hypothetical protein
VIWYSETSASPRDEASPVVGEDVEAAIADDGAVWDDAVAVWNDFIVGEASPAPGWGASTAVPQPTNPATNAISVSAFTERKRCDMS